MVRAAERGTSLARRQDPCSMKHKRNRRVPCMCVVKRPDDDSIDLVARARVEPQGCSQPKCRKRAGPLGCCPHHLRSSPVRDQSQLASRRRGRAVTNVPEKTKENPAHANTKTTYVFQIAGTRSSRDSSSGSPIDTKSTRRTVTVPATAAPKIPRLSPILCIRANEA